MNAVTGGGRAKLASELISSCVHFIYGEAD